MKKKIIFLNIILLAIIGVSLVFAQGVGHGGGTVPILIIELTEEGVSYNITPSRLKFEFNGAPYAIQLREVEQDHAIFLVMILNESDPNNILAYTIDESIILVPSETREVDVNHDDKNDLFIQLKAITYIPPNNIRGANFFIKKMVMPLVITEKSKDLSDYPGFLLNGKFDLTTVVGDKSSSINVLAQTYILPSFLSMAKAVKNKLASEVTDLNQNIISIGNPCINEISAKIMNDPEPCDKDFQSGKGYIRLYKNNDFFHLIVAGYTDLGTKKAAEILANYRSYPLKGNEYVIEFSDDNGDRLTEEKKETLKTQVTEQEQPKKIEAEIEPETETKADIQVETKAEQKIAEEPKTEEKVEPKKEEQKETEKSGNIINKFVSWLLSLFKK